MPTIAVIGGGMSGLAAARLLRDELPDADVRLFEAGDRVGGIVQSELHDGFVCEAGPHGFLNGHPSTLNLALRVGLEPKLRVACERARRRFVLADGRLHRYPHDARSLLATPLLSPPARLRMVLEPLLARRVLPRPGEAVGSFFRRRAGDQVCERLVEPLLAGMCGGDIDRLELDSMLPEVARVAARGESLLLAARRALARASRNPVPDPSQAARPEAIGRRLVSFSGGIGTLTGALAAGLGDSVQLAHPVSAIARDGARWRVAVDGPRSCELAADAVVVAVPPRQASALLGREHRALAEPLRSIRFAPLAVAALGYEADDVSHPLDGFGYLVPRTERGGVLGVLWSSSMFPGDRCAPDRVLLQAILGGRRAPRLCELPPEAIAQRATGHVARVLGTRAAPRVSRVFVHPRGLPQYEPGHRRRVVAIEAALADRPGLELVGNAYRGIGINACTASAERAARRVADHLASRTHRARAMSVAVRAAG